MKAILISDHAKWCALMMNGKKKVELRTNKALYKAIQKLIDENGYADIYVYCTKGKERLVDLRDDNFYCGMSKRLNGKVVFKFRCYKVEEIDVRLGHPEIYVGACVDDLWCLDNGYHDKNYIVRAIHISDLEIFDKPKELSEFKHLVKGNKLDHSIDAINYVGGLPLTKAPQSFCYLEGLL